MPATLLTRQDHGQSLHLPVGATIAVQLDESPTTGYTWADRSDGQVVRPDGDDFTAAAPGAVGGGGLRQWRYSLGQVGTGTLRLVLVQAWAGEAAPTDEFKVTVQADAA
jgi:predicted secreted protein